MFPKLIRFFISSCHSASNNTLVVLSVNRDVHLDLYIQRPGNLPKSAWIIGNDTNTWRIPDSSRFYLPSEKGLHKQAGQANSCDETVSRE